MSEAVQAEILRLIKGASEEQKVALICALLDAVMQSPAGERETLKWLRKSLGVKA